MYKVSLAAVNVPEETYPLMYEALTAGKIGQSEYIAEFEKAIAKYVGANYCIAVSNGTMADAVAVAALKATGRIKPVVVPALTFIAQPNSVRYNELPIEFADIKEDWTMDLKNAPDDWIIFGTDLMGRIMINRTDIEDACESFGTSFYGQRAGTFGTLGTFSFFPSHTISTGEGGAIVTDDRDLAKLCRSIRAHGSVSSDPMDKFHFPNFGFNARMCSLQAVLGIALMKHIDEYVAKRRVNFRIMKEALGGFDERPGEDIVPHGYPIEFVSEEARDVAMRNILEASIECRKFFSCIPMEEQQYKSFRYLGEGHFPVASHVAHTHLYVPCHQNLSNIDVYWVIDTVQNQKGIVKKIGQPKWQLLTKQKEAQV
jgi:perosamine synthetase